jgi:hypothetical protein
MRIKKKSYSIILSLAMMAMFSMVIGCNADNQTAEQKDSELSRIGDPQLSATYDAGLCNIMCRWQPTGQNAFLVYDPSLGKVVIRPFKDYNDMLNMAWQWHAYIFNGQIMFYNDKYHDWLCIDWGNDFDSTFLINSLRLGFSTSGIQAHFSQENQQTINGHIYENLTMSYQDQSLQYRKHILNCENYYQTGFPVYNETMAVVANNPGCMNWWSAQWCISWYSDSD